jgi:serine/threonine protein kinase
MNSRVASVGAADGTDRVDRAVQLLEDEWRRHGEVQLDSFWMEQVRTKAVAPDESLGVLAALIKADLRQRYDQGQTPAVSGYLERFPELRTAHSQVVSLVYEEFCLNEEKGRAPDVQSFCERYPEWKSSLASQIRCHRFFGHAVGLSPPLPRFPEPGETFEEFQLLSLLGQGGTSRVFLAKNLSLGGKQVALKVTLDRGQEPNLQGALDHPHIVPVHSVSYQIKDGLCGLSMPFQPGLPLDNIINGVKPAERPAKAMALWDVLFSADGGGSHAADLPGQESPEERAQRHRLGPRGDGWDGFPARGTYVEGVAWFGMVVARALHHAHSKKTFHRDVKPANILLTIGNGPQLLDFNLADSPHTAAHARAALHGGTLPYMAPEQIEAFLDPELWNLVEARADIYSLGLVLRELLTGQAPDLPEKRLAPARALRELLDRRLSLDVNVRRLNPAIPHALQAIIAKSLAHSPEDRYSDAESLAEDLDRFLKHEPLLAVGNPSRRERAVNWAYRHRRALQGAAGIVAVMALSLAIFASGAFSLRRVHMPRKVSAEIPAGFLSVVADYDDGKVDQTMQALFGLERENPHNWLVKLYLAFALSENAHMASVPEKKGPTESDAENKMLEALLLPDAPAEILQWALRHPEVSTDLVKFANVAIDLADEAAQKYDTDNPHEKGTRDRALRERPYDVARRALLIAENLDPDSPTAQRLLAKTDELKDNYESAQHRLSRAIDAIKSRGKDADTEMLFFCRQLRGRITFLWVDHDRKLKIRSNEQTLNRLDEAKKDLDACARYLEITPFDDQEIKEYRVLHDRASVRLTIAEVEVELSRPGLSKPYFESAKLLIDELDARSKHSKLPQLRKPEELTKRWTTGTTQLHNSTASSAVKPSTAQVNPL